MAPPHDPTMIASIEAAKTISGPHTLYNSTFILELLVPTLPKRHSSHALHLPPPHHDPRKITPQAPPLHLHFLQSETFLVTKGTVNTTVGYDLQDRTWSKSMTPYKIGRWIPHRFWPHPEAEEDSVIYVWAHPDVDEKMDRLFVSDASEGKAKLDLVQMLVTQRASASALIMFSTSVVVRATKVVGAMDTSGNSYKVRRLAEYRALIEKYVGREDWEKYLRTKRA